MSDTVVSHHGKGSQLWERVDVLSGTHRENGESTYFFTEFNFVLNRFWKKYPFEHTLLLITWEFLTCILCILLYSSPTASYNCPRSTSQGPRFVSLFFWKTTHWIHFVLPTHAWLWGHPPEHGRPNHRERKISIKYCGPCFWKLLN